MTTYLAKIGELTLKGSNLNLFERQLVKNTRHYLESVEAKVSLKAGRLYIDCPCESEAAVEFTLSRLVGITAWAKTLTVEKSIEKMQNAAEEIAKNAKNQGAKTFKIECRRIDKSFSLSAYEVCCEAAKDAEKFLKVDVHAPDVTINIEIRERVFVYPTKKGKNQNGNRGLPVGSSGKGVVLLSGGIDSPVAAYRMILRGMQVECIYFHSYPYTSDEAQKKVETLAEKIAEYGILTHLNIVSFTEIQKKLKDLAPEKTLTLLLRICMTKCANLLGRRVGAQAIITGESLGQVASQTIENLTVTESCADFPLLRPLIAMDKEEIIANAIKIGTYETSILPYEDCCVLFSPRHPILKANVDEMKTLFDSLKIEQEIQKAFDERTIIRYDSRGKVALLFGTNEKKSTLEKSTAKKITKDD